MDPDQNVDAGTQAAPATTQVEADAKLRNENASWRLKYRELETTHATAQTEMAGLRTQLTEMDAIKASSGLVVGELQGVHLDAKLRGELATLGVKEPAMQDILIAASSKPLASVTYGADHKPVGEFTAMLKEKVDVLGLGQAPAAIVNGEPAQAAAAPAEGEPAQAAASPAPITVTPSGPLTKTQVMASRQAALDRQRQGLPPR